MDANTLRQLSRQLVRHLGMLDSQCGNMALSPVQAHTLIELADHPATVNEMAVRLQVDKSNASRNLAMLLNQQWVETQPNPQDGRSQIYQLTAQGMQKLEALHDALNGQVDAWLAQMDDDEAAQLGRSLARYSKSIQAAAKQDGYVIRPLTPLDNAATAAVIRRVSAEYGLTTDKGYGVADPILDRMSEVYQADGSAYWVIEYQRRILGGGGIAPLAGEATLCELQKMYFLPELRGRGLARKLAVKALRFARAQGYRGCYLETTANLGEAIALYESLGFVQIPQALGSTGHDACEVRMLKTF
ncbi:bifunctional helix-turn-helix transcriptional regulator/GNAT family N-acetyltransferase [Photobacterium atrarenae]|uniref:Bifunctional helix-turn-helix transcriptional regulator/GNAT family N-acetyltransferase n=1 Tax=Photobacterium atrarenae TaxID=865757 RepID=A0ABY5GE32_9GAMM|nr:bifunctional helix-turn-helix transcriptional regulator/GNAT family N-acetyltransferase [Photobacterium atrarenae]UTV27375.1 bifunctional helix-turn-helix transcriptional regulator/GNAT family N-acetyltransferase [Photobacterium atrarenae]